MGQVLFGNAGAPVGNCENSEILVLRDCHGDFLTGLGVLDRIVQKVYKHLPNEPCVHGNHQKVIGNLNGDFPLRRALANGQHRRADDFLHRLRLLVQGQTTILEPGQAEDVFHKGMKPVRVLVDALRQRKPGIVFLRHVHNHFTGAHDARQRRPQIMGNGPQKIAPVALLIGFLPGADALFHDPQPIHRQRSAFQHGMKKLLLLLCQPFCPIRRNPKNAENGFAAINRPVVEFLSSVKVRPEILNPVPNFIRVGNTPANLLGFTFLLNKGTFRLPLLVKAQAGGMAVHGAADGLHRNPGNPLHTFRVCQMAGQVVQRAGFLLVANSLHGHILRLGGQGAGDHRGHSHDGKGDEIGGILHGQREIGRRKEGVEGAGGQNRGQDAP